jgi:putative holliday junction resolvase
MRTLGIDHGQKRIGLALSDAGGKLATPLEVLQVTSEEAAIGAILELIEKEDVRRIVVGLPLNMDDTLGPGVKKALQFGRELAGRSQREVVYVDERLSTFDAEQTLNSRKRGGEKITRKGRKRQLDAIAAARFLQEYLDGKLAPINPPA